MDIAVTGGAGFIGSNLCEQLVSADHNVTVIDNLSSGRQEWVPDAATLVTADIVDADLTAHFRDVDAVFHLAANPKVDTFPDDRDSDFDTNIVGTKRVLDGCVDMGVDDLLFASSSVVYGEAETLPTPETHRLDPISMYGASKVSGEQLCNIYADRFGIDLTITRLANIVGGRNRKGVVYDFMQKLQNNPETLTILGDGRQEKSYLHINDAVTAIETAWTADERTFNIGSPDTVTVNKIADIVADELGCEPAYDYTGGERGWSGDVPRMQLDISRLRDAGWAPADGSAGAVRKTVRDLRG